MKFDEEYGATIQGIGCVPIDGEHKTDDVYNVEGLRHILLSSS